MRPIPAAVHSIDAPNPAVTAKPMRFRGAVPCAEISIDGTRFALSYDATDRLCAALIDVLNKLEVQR